MIATALVASVLAAPMLAAGPDSAEAVLDRVRGALQYRAMAAHQEGLMLRGQAQALGVPGEYSLVFDKEGRFALDLAGRLPRTLGFDGTTAWEVDFQGIGRTLQLGDRASALLGAWFATGQWVAPPSSIHFADPGEPDAAGVLSLPFDVDGGKTTGAVQISTSTWLPQSFKWSAGATPQTMRVGDYAPRAGLMLPGRVEQEAAGSTVSYTLATAEPAPSFIRSPYEPRPVVPVAAFDATAGDALEVRKAPTGHLLVKPRLDGKETGWFIFDSGAGSSVITPATARTLGLESFGSVHAVGVGGAVAAAFYQPATLSLGPASLEKPLMVGSDLSFLTPHMGVEIAGIIGYDLLSRCIAEIDSAAGAIAIHDPAAYKLPRGEWSPLVLYGRHPCIPARFEGHEGVFKIDTGAMGLTIHAPAVQALDLLNGRETRPAGLGGVGGMVTARMGELESFEVGGRKFDNVKATFATESKAAFGDRYTAGNIGSEILRRFTLVLDYPHGRIALIEPPAPAPK